MSHPTLPASVPGLGLVVFDASGKILVADGSAAAQLGTDVESLLTQNYWALTAPGQKQHELNNLISGPEPFDKEYLLPDGSTATVRVFGGVTRDENGERYHAYLYRYRSNEQSADDSAKVLRHQNAILLSLNQNTAIDAGDIDAALQAITEAGTAGLRCERSSVWLYADNETKIEMLDLYQRTEGKHSSGFALFSKDFPGYFAALAEDRTIAANDAHTHPATREFSQVYLTPLNISSMLEAPIRLNGKLLGVLCTENVGAPKTFSQEEQNFAANVADFVGRALQAKARKDYEQELQRTNANLEKLVLERTASLQVVLDSMGDGLLAVDATGRILPERSRLVAEWFGPTPDDAVLWSYLAPDNATWASTMELALEEMFTGFLPFEVTAAQAPARLVRGERTYALSFRRVGHDEPLSRLVVIIRDITEELAQKRSEQLAREIPNIVTNLIWNRDAFQNFVSETETLFAALNSGTYDLSEAKRHLHTLKGNTAIQGFLTLSAAIHSLEDQVEEHGLSALEGGATLYLLEEFRSALLPLRVFLEEESAESLRLLPEEHQELIASIERGSDRDELIDLVRSWENARVDSLFSPLAKQGQRIAERLSKRVRIETVTGQARLPGSTLQPFFSTLVHVFRNALDHGVETPEEREGAGKTSEGHIVLAARQDAGQFIVEVRDDGRGINWDAVAAKAHAQGLPATTHEELTQALFVDGLSTRDEVTALSGRGVGLSATLAACKALGGSCTVESARGHGTTFRFSFPLGQAAAQRAA